MFCLRISLKKFRDGVLCLRISPEKFRDNMVSADAPPEGEIIIKTRPGVFRQGGSIKSFRFETGINESAHPNKAFRA